jgi:hypothetical protein
VLVCGALFFFQEILAQKPADVVPVLQDVDETVNKPMETVVLPSSVIENINDTYHRVKTTGNSSHVKNTEDKIQESEIQVLKLKFGDDDDAGNELEYKNPVKDQYIFANTRFPVLRYDGYFENSIRGSAMPVVSEVDSNFSRQVSFLCV